MAGKTNRPKRLLTAFHHSALGTVLVFLGRGEVVGGIRLDNAPLLYDVSRYDNEAVTRDACEALAKHFPPPAQSWN